MSEAKTLRRLLTLTPLLVILAAAAPLVAQAARTKTPKIGPPKVSTGGAVSVRGSSATLVGVINPDGAVTNYHFEYGPTTAYGKQTAAATLPAGTTGVKIGRPVTGLLTGYHYRLVASNEHGNATGRDRTFGIKITGKAEFKLSKAAEPTVFGGAYVLSGTLLGSASANRAIALQASPYPFLEAFTEVGLPSHTDASGHFSFRVANMTSSTQYRVSTLDPRPLYSHVITQQVAAKVVLKVRFSGHPGLVRLYGTVTPAKPGAHVELQLFKRVRPGNSPKAEERTGRFATQFTTLVKRGSPTVSRFSVVVSIRHGGSYRAYVSLPKKGAVVPGWSRSLLLHAAPAASKGR